MSSELQRLRAELNEINHQIVDLLVKRFALLKQVFDYKRQKQIELYDPLREQQILDSVCAHVREEDAAPFVLSIMRAILTEGRSHMKRLWSKDRRLTLTDLMGGAENVCMDEAKKSSKLLPLIYSCSGCSSAAQMANHLAIRADREKLAEMSCIAGVGGGVRPLVATAKSGRRVIAIDGCPLKCSEHCLRPHGVKPDVHVVLSDYKISKTYHQDFDPEQATTIFKELVERIKVPE